MKTRTTLIFACLAFFATPLQAQQDTSSYFPLGLWGIWLNQDTLVSPYLPRTLSTDQWIREQENFSDIKSNYLVAWYPYNIFDMMMDYADTAGYRMDTHMGSYWTPALYEFGFPSKYEVHGVSVQMLRPSHPGVER